MENCIKKYVSYCGHFTVENNVITKPINIVSIIKKEPIPFSSVFQLEIDFVFSTFDQLHLMTTKTFPFLPLYVEDSIFRPFHSLAFRKVIFRNVIQY